MAAHHGVGKVDVFDDCLKLATVLPRNLTTEDDREFVRLPNRAIGVQQPIANPIQCCTPREDEIVTIFNLSEKQLVLNTARLTLTGREERREASQPLVTTAIEITRRQGVRHVL